MSGEGLEIVSSEDPLPVGDTDPLNGQRTELSVGEPHHEPPTQRAEGPHGLKLKRLDQLQGVEQPQQQQQPQQPQQQQQQQQ